MGQKTIIATAFARAAAAIALMNPYVDIKNTEKALKEEHLTPTKVGGFDWNPFHCGKGLSRTMFEAANPQGEKVTGTVCRYGLGFQRIHYNKTP